MMPEHAIKAYAELDGSIFQGRLLHVLPAKEKIGQRPEQEESTSYKKKKQAQLKASSRDETSWNTLFMSVRDHIYVFHDFSGGCGCGSNGAKTRS
jgi:multiple RNA-binding domain-containing protein 1